MKKFIAAFLVGLCVTSYLSLYSETVNASLSQNLIRLHVLANSDSQEDQALKLKVRDRIISECAPLFENCKTTAESTAAVLNNMDALKAAAEDEIARQGYDYPVFLTFDKHYFPTKYYQNVSLPAGDYNALRVLIGDAQGQNWWCVLFPPLCFVNGSGGTLPEASQEQLKENLSPEDYDLITSEQVPVKVKFKIVELFQETFHKQ